MALLSDETISPVTNNSGFIDPNLLMLALGSGLLTASAPSPYKRGTFGLGIAQGMQNYLTMLPNLEKAKQMQAQQQIMNWLFGNLYGNQAQQQQATQQNTFPKIDLTSLPVTDALGLTRPQLTNTIGQTVPTLEQKVSDWLGQSVNEELKKKDMEDFSDITQYPMYAEGATDVPVTVSQTQMPSQQDNLTNILLGRPQQQQKQEEFTGIAKMFPEIYATNQMLKALSQQQAPQATVQDKFPLDIKQMMMLKAFGIDLFPAYDAWLKSKTPVTVGEGQVAIDPVTGNIVMKVPKTGEGIELHKDPQTGEWIARPIKGYLETLGEQERIKKEAEEKTKAKYDVTKTYTPTGDTIYTSRLDIVEGKSQKRGTFAEKPQNILMGEKITEKVINQIVESEGTISSQLEDFYIARDLIKDAKTGSLADAQMKLARIAESFGIQPSDNINNTIWLEKLANKMAMQARNPAFGGGLPGAVSEKELDFLRKSVINIKDPKELTKRYIDYNIMLLERIQERNNFFKQWASQYGNFYAKDPFGKNAYDVWNMRLKLYDKKLGGQR